MDEELVEVTLLDANYTFNIKHEDQQSFLAIAKDFERLLRLERDKNAQISRDNAFVLVGLNLLESLTRFQKNQYSDANQEHIEKLLTVVDSAIENLNKPNK